MARHFIRDTPECHACLVLSTKERKAGSGQTARLQFCVTVFTARQHRPSFCTASVSVHPSDLETVRWLALCHND